MSAAEIAVFEQESPSTTAEAVAHASHGVIMGTLVGFDAERAPLVIHKGRPHAAVAAATIVDLHGAHIGRRVVLQFEEGNPDRPIVMGLLQSQAGWPLDDKPAQVEVDVDGKRMVVSAKEQLVLRCGKASVTLTKAGKVLIQGTYISNQSSGVMRIKGGSVQLN
jgi:hypothetical protein